VYGHKPRVGAFHTPPVGGCFRLWRAGTSVFGLLIRGLALSFLFLVFCGGAFANVKSVWVVLSEAGEPHAELGRVLFERLPDLDVRVRPWNEFDAADPPPAAIIAVGARALREVTEDARRRWPHVPVVATLVARSQLDRLIAIEGRRVTGIYLDPPFPLQFSLLRLTRPEWRRVGVLLGPDSSVHRDEIERAARAAGVELVLREVESADQLAAALQTVLGADVLLAVPDSLIYSARTVQHILLSSYRRNVPVLGFSAAFVRAGALLGLHAPPDTLASQTAGMVREVVAGGRPAPRAVGDFEVMVNANVGRSLGIQLNAAALSRALRAERGRP